MITRKRFIYILRRFAFIFFYALFGFALCYTYLFAGNMYGSWQLKVFLTFVYPLVMIYLAHSLRRILRIQQNRQIAVVIVVTILFINIFKWLSYTAWMYSFQWVVGGLHPFTHTLPFLRSVLDFIMQPIASFMFWMGLVDEGWVVYMGEFEYTLHGNMLLAVWVLEFLIISVPPVFGAYIQKAIFLPDNGNWAILVKLPYAFKYFTPEDIAEIENKGADVIHNTPLSEDVKFTQVAKCYSGRRLSNYIAVCNATVNEKGKVKYERPNKIINIGEDSILILEAALKQTHDIK